MFLYGWSSLYWCLVSGKPNSLVWMVRSQSLQSFPGQSHVTWYTEPAGDLVRTLLAQFLPPSFPPQSPAHFTPSPVSVGGVLINKLLLNWLARRERDVSLGSCSSLFLLSALLDCSVSDLESRIERNSLVLSEVHLHFYLVLLGLVRGNEVVTKTQASNHLISDVHCFLWPQTVSQITMWPKYSLVEITKKCVRVGIMTKSRAMTEFPISFLFLPNLKSLFVRFR